jgi:hypothetical protein
VDTSRTCHKETDVRYVSSEHLLTDFFDAVIEKVINPTHGIPIREMLLFPILSPGSKFFGLRFGLASSKAVA